MSHAATVCWCRFLTTCTPADGLLAPAEADTSDGVDDVVQNRRLSDVARELVEPDDDDPNELERMYGNALEASEPSKEFATGDRVQMYSDELNRYVTGKVFGLDTSTLETRLCTAQRIQVAKS